MCLITNRTVNLTGRKYFKRFFPSSPSLPSHSRVGGRGGGGGCTQLVHGLSRMNIDPRIPTMPGRSTSSFNQPGRHCLHQARSAVRCSASRMKGELHPSKNHSYDGLRQLVPTFLLMDDSANELLCFLVWLLQRQQWVLLCNCLVGALRYSQYVMRSFPLCGVKVLHPAQCDLVL